METIKRTAIEHGTLADYQTIRRSVGEAARLKATHRYFQRRATRRPFRKDETEEPTWTLL